MGPRYHHVEETVLIGPDVDLQVVVSESSDI